MSFALNMCRSNRLVKKKVSCCLVLAFITCSVVQFLPQQESENVEHLKLTRTKFLLNEPTVCTTRHSDIKMLTIVHSATHNFEHRQVIRETWGNASLYQRVHNVVLFALGTSDNATVTDQIRSESEQFHDVIQGNFVDSYRNLTLKAQMWLEWTTLFCPRVKFVLKSDDDMTIDVFKLSRFLGKFSDAENLIFCNLWSKPVVFRDFNSKWHVNESEYPERFYPDYCWGWAYVLTGDLVPKMFATSLRTKFFWIDDVFVTGTVAKQLGVKYYKLEKNFANSPFNSKFEIAENSIFFNEKSYSRRLSLWKSILEIHKETNKKQIIRVDNNYALSVKRIWEMGIGNDMFQTASLLALARKSHKTAVLDASHPLRQIFDLPVELERNSNWKVLKLDCPTCYNATLTENLRQLKNVKLDGYLQSFRYFEEHLKHLRTDFFPFKQSLKTLVDLKRKEILQLHCSGNISNCLMIGVHIRRGDFLTNKSKDFGFLVADKEYLSNAFQHYLTKFPTNQLIFTVLGTDYEWNMQNVPKGLNTTILVLNSTTSAFDFCFLSTSDHFIMTVGTFGWMAAALSDGNVIFYRNYAKVGSEVAKGFESKNYFPPDWIPL